MDVPRTDRPRRLRPAWVASGVAAGVVAVTVALSSLSRALPEVERASVRIDAVERGPMVRALRAPGTLVPTNVRWITAETAGRVERLAVRRGATVRPEDVLLELANPDVNLAALDSERQLASAEAELVTLRTQLASDRLTAEAAVATLRAERADAARLAAANERLRAGGNASDAETARARERLEELEARLSLQSRRLEVLGAGLTERIAAQRAQIDRLRAVARFRAEQLARQRVKAAMAGVVQELPLELGQWVVPGQLLARVAGPGRLRADLRVPESLAGEVAPGQEAVVDTRSGVVRGRVSRVAPSASQGTVTVEVELGEDLPAGTRADLSVDGEIVLERLADALHVGRPAYAQAGATVELYRLAPDGATAERVKVKLGKASAASVEIESGLAEGDRVVLSDVPGAEGAQRVRIR